MNNIEKIHHICLKSDLEKAKEKGIYEISTKGKKLAEVGFIHCCFSSQLESIHNKFYADEKDVLVMTLCSKRIKFPIRVEPDLFGKHYPHIYGPIHLYNIEKIAPYH